MLGLASRQTSMQLFLHLFLQALLAVAVEVEARPLMRQEHNLALLDDMEITSRGRISPEHEKDLEQAVLDRDIRGTHDVTSYEMPQAGVDFSEHCVDYPRLFDSDSAGPVPTGQMPCALSCIDVQNQYPQYYSVAKDRCCNCGGGAQFHSFKDTQCAGEGGLSASRKYDGVEYTNPQSMIGASVNAEPFQSCMETCWAMGEECTAITVVNSNAANSNTSFGGKCFFRKGRLKYTHDYSATHNPRTWSEVPQDATRLSDDTATKDTRLVFCTDETILQNIECTTDPTRAKPKRHVKHEAEKTVDDVVDNRDCFVKYLYWQP